MTAENRPRAAAAESRWTCFNEAAADDRGKPWVPGEIVTAAQLLQ